MSYSIEDLLTLSFFHLQLSLKGDRSEVILLTFTSGAKNSLDIKDVYENSFLLTVISKAAHIYLNFQGQVMCTIIEKRLLIEKKNFTLKIKSIEYIV